MIDRMASVVAYDRAMAELLSRGMVCLYFNSGSFGFEESREVVHAGWLIGDDASLTPRARDAARVIDPPETRRLAQLAGALWRRVGGPAWLMPGSHWAYELDFATPDLAGVLEAAGIAPRELDVHDGRPVQFDPHEAESFEAVVSWLLDSGTTSDYRLALLGPGGVTVSGIIHHHRQLWWTTPAPSSGLLGA